MRVEYSKRALADLRQIAAYYACSGSPAVAESIAARIREVVAHLVPRFEHMIHIIVMAGLVPAIYVIASHRSALGGCVDARIKSGD